MILSSSSRVIYQMNFETFNYNKFSLKYNMFGGVLESLQLSIVDNHYSHVVDFVCFCFLAIGMMDM